MMEKWNIAITVKALVNSPEEENKVLVKIKDEMSREIALFKVLKGNKSSKFKRSTAISNSISKNYRMMKCIQHATENSE